MITTAGESPGSGEISPAARRVGCDNNRGLPEGFTSGGRSQRMRLHRHMSAVRWLGVIVCLLFVAGAAFDTLRVSAGGRAQSRAASTAGPIYPPRPSASFGKLALSFEDNRGQAG